ncbi:BRO-N domain-containing protein [Streptococcus pyogenes]|uniref:BRO-N domain-containing protein n=1 Tax=Streptococcus pyogenes TaxID=1314 RepID=UPI0010A158F7|nr:Bro-N domain-containing protein [Streptococcus pyogenes]VHA78491.1 phage antirepressor protein [Streptococcus pyogenes]VHB70474.1 phage antirepressor protein [Streptococcus pyogenes]VHD12794.1 phage antirepressor protein [Streptococcus pyogenes]
MDKAETWNGYTIRFVENNGEWWAVAKDITNALGLKQPSRAISTLKGVTKSKTLTKGGEQELSIINEKDIYRLVFKSRKPEAEAFQEWVFEIIKQLRQSTGLEGFQVFRMLDKEHQKQAMNRLINGLEQIKQTDLIKANTIANKAVSNKYGLPKMISKSQMTEQMLKDREQLLDDTVELMVIKDKFDLGVSVSNAIYSRATH